MQKEGDGKRGLDAIKIIGYKGERHDSNKFDGVYIISYLVFEDTQRSSP